MKRRATTPPSIVAMPTTVVVSGWLVLVVLLLSIAVSMFSSLALATPSAASTTLPRPPRQTEGQRKAWLEIAEIAEEASKKALPQLLEYLDSNEFRGQISNLPFANESVDVLYERLDQAYMTAPLFHNINGGREEDLNPWDAYLFQQVNLSFIPNEWQTHLLGDMNNTWLHPVYWEETQLFHLPRLPDINNVTVKEAEGRMLYSGVNVWRFASGLSAYYGGVGFVLSPSYIRNMTALSPYDIGFYHACCVANWTRCTQNLNHSCAPFVAGTFEHHNHLFLQSTYFWQRNFLPEVMQRVYSPNPPTAWMNEVVLYWEGDVLGNIVFPEGVQYVNADFTSLFADSRGKLLIEWCRQNNWTLVWGFSFINEYNDQIAEEIGNYGFIDPNNIPLANVSVPSSVIDTFWDSWEEATEAISNNATNLISVSFWNSTWMNLYHALPESIQFKQLRPYDCQDTTNCFGTSPSGGYCFCL